MSATNHEPPRASLLGLPSELRQLLYDAVFLSDAPTREDSLHHRYQGCYQRLAWYSFRNDVASDERNAEVHPFSERISNGYESLIEHSIILTDPGYGNYDAYSRLAAFYTLPIVSRAVRLEVWPLVCHMPPIDKIKFCFKDLTLEGMSFFLDALGPENVCKIRKFDMRGWGPCKSQRFSNGHAWNNGLQPCSFHIDGDQNCDRGCEEYRNGHLWRGGQRSCSFHTSTDASCDSRCSPRSAYFSRKARQGLCQRKIQVNLDRHEHDVYKIEYDEIGQLPYRRQTLVPVERTLKTLKTKCGLDKKLASEVLSLHRHVVIPKVHHPGPGTVECLDGDILRDFFDENDDFKVTKGAILHMLRTITGPHDMSTNKMNQASATGGFSPGYFEDYFH